MTRTAFDGLPFDNSFARELGGLFTPWSATPSPAPRLLALNEQLCADLGLDPAAVRTSDGVAVLAGNAVPSDAEPIAQAYAGHQFGGFSPRLGDGRALLLGEVADVRGRRRDLHYKGSGRTPYARGGDGKAAVGPMLREYIVGEALHALGIPTTRALSVIATGETIRRDEGMVPGALLTRIAASHLRVGSFQYAAGSDDPTLLPRLADYAIARHAPHAIDADQPYVALFETVVAAQATLVAQWMLVGFVHGVMNTDNMTISGESIDFGPCAFMDRYDPATVFSSIDHGGRYAFGNQPPIAQWNLARFAETLLPLMDRNEGVAVELATATLRAFADRYNDAWLDGMRRKLGLTDGAAADDEALINDLLSVMHSEQLDYTTTFRQLASSLRNDSVSKLDEGSQPLTAWVERWAERVGDSPLTATAVADQMDQVNPLYIPRNHLVEEALAAATASDLVPFEQLVDVLTHPFDAQPGRERYAVAAPPSAAAYRTFCGT